MTIVLRFLSLLFCSAFFISCANIPPATVLKQADGVQFVSVAPGAAKEWGKAVEAFHQGAQKNQPAGSYRYRYETTTNSHARTTGGVPIPYGSGPIAGGLMILGNIAMMQKDQPNTYSVSGYTTPQSPLKVRRNQKIKVSWINSSQAYSKIDQASSSALRGDVLQALRDMGLNPGQSGSARLSVSVQRASPEASNSTIEMTAKKGTKGTSRMGYLILKQSGAARSEAIRESLSTMISVY